VQAKADIKVSLIYHIEPETANNNEKNKNKATS